MNKNSPKVSIVLPTYNGAKYLRQSIDSCLKQTYENIELIIVNDGSTDETNKIVNSYKDERIKYIRHEENMGLPFALNTGFSRAIGKYLTWTSDDNYYSPEAIERMLSFILKKKCHFVYSDYYRFRDANKDINLFKSPVKIRLENYNHIGPCFLYSRNVKEVIGKYDTDAILAEDYDYWIRISKKFDMHHLSEPLYYYRIDKESLFISKYYDVKVGDLLVRLKNNVASVEQISTRFVNLILMKREKMRWIYKVLIKLSIKKRIKYILKNFENDEMSFSEVRNILKKFINGRLIWILFSK